MKLNLRNTRNRRRHTSVLELAKTASPTAGRANHTPDSQSLATSTHVRYDSAPCTSNARKSNTTYITLEYPLFALTQKGWSSLPIGRHSLYKRYVLGQWNIVEYFISPIKPTKAHKPNSACGCSRLLSLGKKYPGTDFLRHVEIVAFAASTTETADNLVKPTIRKSEGHDESTFIVCSSGGEETRRSKRGFI